MSTLPAGYRFEKLAADYVLLARQGEVVSRFYTPDDPDAGVIVTDFFGIVVFPELAS